MMPYVNKQLFKERFDIYLLFLQIKKRLHLELCLYNFKFIYRDIMSDVIL